MELPEPGRREFITRFTKAVCDNNEWQTARRCNNSHQRHVVRLTHGDLLRVARSELNFSRTPLPGAPGCDGTYVMDDGYSLCGMADAHCAQREEAGNWGRLCLRMARLLKENGQ